MNHVILNQILEILPWMLAAGIDLLQALTLITHQQTNKTTRAIMQQLCRSIEQGESFSSTLKAQIKMPHAVFICIRTGEVSGQLPQCLSQAYDWMRAQRAFKRGLRSQLFYPALLFAVLLVCLVLAFSVIMPSFERLYHQFQAPLPAATRSLMHAYDAFNTHFLHTFFSGLSLVLCTLLALKRLIRLRLCAERCLLQLPWAGKLLRIAIYQRFCQLLGILLNAGIHLNEALHLLSCHMSLHIYRAALHQAALDISQGESLAIVLRASKLFDPALIRLLALGSESGRLDNVLNQLAMQYAQQLKERQKHFKQIIQPILMLCVGVLIGAWVLLLYYPLIQLGSLIG